MTGRLLAIGDIHGCDTALRTLLEAIAPTRDDTVVVLGDVVDRGPGVRQCIEMLIALQSQCRLVFLEGNHEEMMLNSFETGDWLNAWLDFGGLEALNSYGSPPNFKNIPEAHWTFLRGQDYFAEGNTLFVHANLQPGVPLGQQSSQWLRWQRLVGSEAIFQEGKRVVCGHTSQKSGLPKVFPGWVCIDTYCYGGLWLTALDVTTDEVWQTNESGQLRGPMPLLE